MSVSTNLQASPWHYGLMTEQLNHAYDGGCTPSWCTFVFSAAICLSSFRSGKP
jgi:hypothetical protein